MCRLFGWAGPRPVSAARLLGSDLPEFQALSRIHRDGWGAAWWGDSGLQFHRDVDPAFTDPRFAANLGAATGRVGLVHLRWATGDIPVCLENTHPFCRGEVGFAHNGSVPESADLDRLVDPDLLASMTGTNDSERYFLAVLSARRRGETVVGSFAEVIGALRDVDFPSLNALWIERDGLYAVSAHHADLRPEGTEPDYYDLQFDTRDGTTSVWSTQVVARPGNPLGNFSVLCLTAATGGSEVVAL